MTTRSTRGAVPLALAFATLTCAWLACARPAEAAPAAASVVAAASAAGASAPPATQYAVKPGQSLADIAATATQSHDKAVIGRAAKAIFDANPSAFMRGDPSLLKLGAVLNVPPLDATGAVVKNETMAAPASGAALGAAPTSATAAASQTVATTKAGGAQAGYPVSAASAAAPAPAAQPASVGAAASAPAKAPAPAAAHAQPNAPGGASGAHAWSGAIQPAPVVPASAAGASAASAAEAASGASATAASAASAASVGEAAPGASSAAGGSAAAVAAASATRAAGPASAAAAASSAASHPKVSSLQQLLTLKNRVLMELQRHGFGTPSPAPSGAAGHAPASAAGFAVAPAASGVVAPAPGQSRAAAAANQRFIGIGGVGFGVSRDDMPAMAAVGAAVVAALVVLLAALGISRRKRRETVSAKKAAVSATQASPASGDELAAPMPRSAATGDDPFEAELLAILARNPSSKRALMGLAAHYAERKNASGFDEIAQRIYRLSGGRGPNWVHVAALGRQLDPDNPLFSLGAGEADDAVLTGTPEGDAAIEPASEAVPPAGPPADHAQAGAALPELTDVVSQTPPAAEPELPHEGRPEAGMPLADPARQEMEPEPRAEVEPPEGAALDQAETHEAEPHEAEPHEAEPHGAEPHGAEPHEVQAHEADSEALQRPEVTLPPEAIAALGDLDLGLPPRIESGADSGPPMVAATHAEASSQEHPLEQEYERPEPAHPAAEHAEPPAQAEAGERVEPEPAPAPVEPEVRPSVAGLGAAPIGPLKLSFDLDLPGAAAGQREDSMAASAPLPQFTPEQLAKIARNKLELATEYIALGDVGGARTLISEVIESNDAATRDEAHALLATLAPLS